MNRFGRLSFVFTFFVAVVITPARSTVAAPTSITFGAAGDHGANSKTAASLNKLDASGVDFYLAIGDLDYKQTTPETPEAWCDYISSRLPTLGSDFPFQLLAGNHEENTIHRHAACLPDRMGSTISPSGQYATEYFFDYPRTSPLVRVLMISPGLTINNVAYNYSSGGTRYNWVAGAIDDARSAGIPWVVVGMHKYCSGSCEIGADLMNMLVRKRVDLVLQGHDHTYKRSKQLALGTGCSSVAGSYNAQCVARDGLNGLYTKGRGTVVSIIGCFGMGSGSSPSGYWVKTGGSDGFTKFTVTAERIDAEFVRSTGTSTDTYSIIPNQPPTINAPGNRDDAEGQAVNVAVESSDPEGDPVTYSATALPPGLSINPSTGVISGVLATGGQAGSPYATRITATDAVGFGSTAQMSWIVRDVTPPVSPTGLSISRETTGVLLDWPDNTEVDLAGYNVFRSSSAAGPFSMLNDALLTSSVFFDEAAPAGATSYYEVKAVDHVSNASSARTGSVRRSKIVFVSQTVSRGKGMSMTITQPPGVASGDVLLTGIAVRGTTTILPPSGWALVSQVSRSTGGINHQAVFRHTVSSADPASYTFTFVGRSAAVATTVAYHGAAAIPQRSAGQANPALMAITAPSLTSTVADAVLVGFFGIGADTAVSPPAGTMERSEFSLSPGPIRVTLAAVDDVVAAQALGTRIATASKPSENIGQVVLLSPTG